MAFPWCATDYFTRPECSFSLFKANWVQIQKVSEGIRQQNNLGVSSKTRTESNKRRAVVHLAHPIADRSPFETQQVRTDAPKKIIVQFPAIVTHCGTEIDSILLTCSHRGLVSAGC
jgi:hypothetical protein